MTCWIGLTRQNVQARTPAVQLLRISIIRFRLLQIAGIVSACNIGKENIVCARKTKKENEPDPVKSGTQDFAWQYFEVVDEKTAIQAVAEFSLSRSFTRRLPR